MSTDLIILAEDVHMFAKFKRLNFTQFCIEIKTDFVITNKIIWL